MRTGLRPRRALALAVVALVAEWCGHTLTWCWTGGADPGQALTGSTHAYLQPLGITLAVVAVALIWLVVRALALLDGRAQALRHRLRQAWRSADAGTGVAVTCPADRPGRAGRARRSGSPAVGFGVAGLTATLAAAQLGVYFVQENLEARAVGLEWPGLHVFTAHHGSALLVHLVVALVAAVLVRAVQRRIAGRARTVDRLAALVEVLLAPRRRAGSVPSPGERLAAWTVPLAAALAPRPPPVAVAP